MRLTISPKEKTFRVYIDIGVDSTGYHPLPSERAIERLAEDITNPRERDEFIESQKELRESFSQIESIWAEFLRWGWGTRMKLQNESIEVLPLQGPIRNPAKYRRDKFKKLFRGWSLELFDHDNKPVELKFDRSGELSEESMQVIENAPELVRIIDAILDEVDLVLELGEEPVDGSGALGGEIEESSESSSVAGSEEESTPSP